MTLNLTPIVHTCLPICICQEADCHQPMAVYFQPSDFVKETIYKGRTGYFQATCKNKACDFFGFTLNPETHETMPEEKREEYRQQRRRQRAAEERRIAILTYTFNRAEQDIYGCCLSTWCNAITPALEREELKHLVKMQYLVEIAPGAYFITPDGCELIDKDFAALGKTLSHHLQWDLCLKLLDAGIDLSGVIDETQQARVTWSIERKALRDAQRKR
jgi:hypothetical protein